VLLQITVELRVSKMGKVLGPEREEVTGSWTKQSRDGGKNGSTYVALVWKYEGKGLL
jgi:hypothetical protein